MSTDRQCGFDPDNNTGPVPTSFSTRSYKIWFCVFLLFACNYLVQVNGVFFSCDSFVQVDSCVPRVERLASLVHLPPAPPPPIISPGNITIASRSFSMLYNVSCRRLYNHHVCMFFFTLSTMLFCIINHKCWSYCPLVFVRGAQSWTKMYFFTI